MSDISEIIKNATELQSSLPYRSNFERENFLFNTVEGPRLAIVLITEINRLNSELQEWTDKTQWRPVQISKEIEIVNSKLEEVVEEYSITAENFSEIVEEGEPDFWSEQFARQAAIEALTQEMTHDNMKGMLSLPLDLYEQSIVKCQTYINLVSKTTRAAERKANTTGIKQD